jgi:hypothetical protein
MNDRFHIRPAYPPWDAPAAPVPAGGVSLRGPFPDGVPGSPGPAWPPASREDNTGKSHGIQMFPKWKPGEIQKKGVVDDLRALHLWRLVIVGGAAMRVDIKWGTEKTFTLMGLSLPLRCTVPGQLTVDAYPVVAQETEQSVQATLTPATSGGLIELRRPAVVGAFDDRAFGYFALTASVLNIRGVVTAVAALQRVPLLAGSSLTSGDGYEEFDT